MKIKQILTALEAALPLWMQENWDNSGLQVGDPEAEVTGVLIALDPLEAVIEEAVRCGCNLVVTHHPLLFRGLKRISTSTDVERAVRLAIRHDITVYSAHTNADNAPEGLNCLLARELGLTNVRPLTTLEHSLMELSVYVPASHLEIVREALWSAGAGRIGQYDSCSFAHPGQGTFRPLDGANPYIGSIDTLEQVNEHQLTVVLPRGARHAVVSALERAHPYEVPAYSLRMLDNQLPTAGSGIVGDLEAEEEASAFFDRVRALFATDKMMVAGADAPTTIRRVALCGGAGAFLQSHARRAGADVFITGEAKYNDYLDAEGLSFVTVGHYESEVIATRLFAKIIVERCPEVRLLTTALDNNKIKSL